MLPVEQRLWPHSASPDRTQSTFSSSIHGVRGICDKQNLLGREWGVHVLIIVLVQTHEIEHDLYHCREFRCIITQVQGVHEFVSVLWFCTE